MKEKKEVKIFGISIWRLLAYFTIYSVIGFLVETVFGVLTKGLLESRKSFLYGPFCGIYGIGAIFMIISLKRFNKNKLKLFLGGFFVGSFLEYLISLIGQIILNVVWWDYSDKPFNINGRICVSFSLFWGILAIFLLDYLNPKIDKLLNHLKEKYSKKLLKSIMSIITAFLVIDFFLTGIALKMFFARTIEKHNIEVQNKTNITLYLNKNNFAYQFAEKYFSDEKMIKTFPNLKITDVNGKIIYIDSLLPEIQPYYIKLFVPKENLINDIM